MINLGLFSEIMDFDTETEGIKYIGSKSKLLPQILEVIHQTGAQTVLDGFSGSGRVSQVLAKNGFRVISNDIAPWSQIFGDCYLGQHKNIILYKELIAHLNALPSKDGWFSQHYGGATNGGISQQEDGQKKPWQYKNTRRLDAIREEIDNLNLDKTTRAVALTSLIIALDRVDNTLGHYVSYLKKWSLRSYGDMYLRMPAIFKNEQKHKVSCGDIFTIADQQWVDLAYFDPPYGSNNDKMPPSRVRYASYYHIWKTVCLNDRPQLFGKCNRRRDSSDTLNGCVFEEFRKNDRGRFIAVEALEKLINQTFARYILLSYSSSGRAKARELRQILQAAGRIKCVVEQNYKKNVMSCMTWTNNWIRDIQQPHREFLFLLEK